MQKYSILLDGSNVPPSEFSGAEGSRVTESQADGGTTIAYASAITFYGQARDYILGVLVYGANPQTAFVSIKIFDECCKDDDGNAFLIFDGKTSRADISFCDPDFNADCGVECTIIDASLAGEKVQCLRNVLINQVAYRGVRTRGSDTYRTAPQFGYYDETRPKSFMNLSLYFAFLLLGIFFPFVLIASILTLFLVDLSPLYNGILENLLKKRYHKAPLIHSYLTNVCQLCGLTLRSSLFNAGGAYHNLTRLDTPFSEGAKNGGRDAELIYLDFNSPNITLPELMQSLVELNISYSVTDAELIVERKDFFNNNPWVDFSTRQADILELCFEAADEAQPAGEIFKFADDGTDKTGNEVNRLWSGDIVDYNTPIAPTLRGIKQTVLQYGTARFIGDGQDSVIENWTGSILATFLSLGNITVDKGAMLMSSGTASVPKLIIWDSTSPLNDGRVEVTNGLYNGRAWLNPEIYNNNGVIGFYENLLKINDPRLNLIRNLQYTLRFSYICSDLRTRTFGQTIIIPINGTNVVAKIDSVEIDFTAHEITISGVL